MLAGIIPVYTIQNNESDYIFSVNQRVTPEINILDYALYTCAIVSKIIIIICRPDQIPYFKYRYGDVFINHLDDSEQVIKYQKDKNSNPVPIYYISVATKYASAKIDTEAFNIFHIANIFSKAMEEGYMKKEPKSLFIVFPWIVIHPYEFMKENKRRYHQFRELMTNSVKSYLYDDVVLPPLRFGIKSNDQMINLPNNSHCILQLSQMNLIYDIFINHYKEYKKHNIKKEIITDLTFKELTDQFFDEDYHLFIPEEHYFDVRTWSGYLRLLNWVENNKHYYKQYTSHWMSRQSINMTNLTYAFEDPSMEDASPYYIDYASSVEKRRFISWKKRRAKLRTTNNNGKT